MKLKSFKTLTAVKMKKTMETHYSIETSKYESSAIYNKDCNCVELTLDDELILIPQSNISYMVIEEIQEQSKSNKKSKKEE